MPGLVCFLGTNVFNFQLPYNKESTIIVPVLYMRKLRHKSVQLLGLDCTSVDGGDEMPRGSPGQEHLARGTDLNAGT